MEELTVKEQIDCGFHRVGRLGVAFKPQHFESMRAKQSDLTDYFGHDTTLLSKSDLRAELGSDYYHGALLDALSAHLHVGTYVHGLAEAAELAGAQIHERNAATALHRLPEGGFLVETLHGTIRATQVMAATLRPTPCAASASPGFRCRSTTAPPGSRPSPGRTTRPRTGCAGPQTRDSPIVRYRMPAALEPGE
ncbi:FAD-binding oxidoreductase [Streptomyces sp. MNU76]|uniref:FAD-dependent oxidoreductase n=1 Tax=Streptomyces sp. MNU76 TaxID=2560026 RepID=UPI001E2AE600|nr:FAD-dependent oxidoreductase [Streptomyces sp. MNU76]MCC9707562.1 FAD-binding oxidoreductase [Streptomyces sp. MNU76]